MPSPAVHSPRRTWRGSSTTDASSRLPGGTPSCIAATAAGRSPKAARLLNHRPTALPLPFHQLSSSWLWWNRKTIATNTNMPITTSTQDDITKATKTVSALATMDGMARVRNTVLAT